MKNIIHRVSKIIYALLIGIIVFSNKQFIQVSSREYIILYLIMVFALLSAILSGEGSNRYKMAIGTLLTLLVIAIILWGK